MEGLERVEKLLAMILLHDMQDAPQGERSVALERAGFGASEIAGMLGTTPGVVSQRLHEARKSKGRKKPDRKKATRKKASRKKASGEKAASRRTHRR